MVFMMAIDNLKIQTPQGLFGGYAPQSIPGVSVASADLMQRLEAGDAIDLDITEVLRSHSIGGEWGNEFLAGRPGRTWKTTSSRSHPRPAGRMMADLR